MKFSRISYNLTLLAPFFVVSCPICWQCPSPSSCPDTHTHTNNDKDTDHDTDIDSNTDIDMGMDTDKEMVIGHAYQSDLFGNEQLSKLIYCW